MFSYKHLFLLPLLALAVACKNPHAATSGDTDADTAALTQVKFCADSALATIQAQCAFGPRVPNSEAHRACGNYIVARFKALGLEVQEQHADLKAWDGRTLKARNIIASYKPERKYHGQQQRRD